VQARCGYTHTQCRAAIVSDPTDGRRTQQRPEGPRLVRMLVATGFVGIAVGVILGAVGALFTVALLCPACTRWGRSIAVLGLILAVVGVIVVAIAATVAFTRRLAS